MKSDLIAARNAAPTIGAGRGLRTPRKRWTQIDASEVGRPHYRFRRNPVPSTTTQGGGFPYGTISSDGQELELVEWGLYDYAEAAVATQMQTLTYFKVGLGQPLVVVGGAGAAPSKTLLHTNLDSQNGVLPNPQSMLVRTLRCRIRPNIGLADLINVGFATFAQFQAGDLNRPYFQGPAADIPTAQDGIYGATAVATGAASTGALAMGWPTIHNQYDLRTGLIDPNIGAPDQGVVINQGRTFSFSLNPGLSPTFNDNTSANTIPWTTLAGGASGGTGVAYWAVLQGVLARAKAG
jgi:hypothetical protein